MSLKEVKNKIRAVKKIAQVTKAMEAVSAVKMRRSQASALLGRPYALHAMSVLRRISAGANIAHHPLVFERPEVKKICLVIVSSDRGLAGALNTNLFRKAHALIRAEGWQREDIEIIAVGKKCAEHFTHRGFTVTDRFSHWGEGVALDAGPDEVARELITRFSAGRYDACYLIYTNFHSTFKQEPIARRFLPISLVGFKETVESIVPEKGKYSELRALGENGAAGEYTFEPNAETVLEKLLPSLVAIELYHSVLESNASEHSARMVAMKTASDHARDLTRDLTLSYNKERQSAITAEIGEITSGIEAMG